MFATSPDTSSRSITMAVVRNPVWEGPDEMDEEELVFTQEDNVRGLHHPLKLPSLTL